MGKNPEGPQACDLLSMAVNRAKRPLVLVRMKKTLAIAVKNDAMIRRRARLAGRLVGLGRHGLEALDTL